MRILSDVVLEAYRDRIVNIHPSLLPAFKGAHAIADAFAYGVKVFGVTIHYVNGELDGGRSSPSGLSSIWGAIRKSWKPGACRRTSAVCGNGGKVGCGAIGSRERRGLVRIRTWKHIVGYRE